MNVIKVAIADDHKIFRKGVVLSLRPYTNIRFVLEAENGDELLAGLPEAQPDVILMDVYMPRMDGIESAHCIREFLPNVCVIGMSSASTASLQTQFVSAGGRAFLPKEVAVDSLVELIRRELSV